MTILISDARVRAVPVRESGEPLIAVPGRGGPGPMVRVSVATRLADADALLPHGIRLHVVDGFRTAASQRGIIEAYSATLREQRPGLAAVELERLVGRYVAPLDVAPHVAGAAVDLTLVDDDGRELDLGCPLDATPEDSAGRCCFAADDLTREATGHRALLALVLGAVGLVNYPTEWWHWSYGDRYWAMATGAPYALYGPLGAEVAA